MSDSQKHSINRLPSVIQQVGLSRSTIYLLLKSGAFPKPVKLSERAVGWHQCDIDDWLASRTVSGEKEVA